MEMFISQTARRKIEIFSRDEKDICAFNINGCSLPTGKYPAMCYSAADYRIKSRYFDTEDIVS